MEIHRCDGRGAQHCQSRAHNADPQIFVGAAAAARAQGHRVKIIIPVGENRNLRSGKPLPKSRSARSGKPLLLPRSGNPDYYLYLGVGVLGGRLASKRASTWRCSERASRLSRVRDFQPIPPEIRGHHQHHRQLNMAAEPTGRKHCFGIASAVRVPGTSFERRSHNRRPSVMAGNCQAQRVGRGSQSGRWSPRGDGAPNLTGSVTIERALPASRKIWLTGWTKTIPGGEFVSLFVEIADKRGRPRR